MSALLISSSAAFTNVIIALVLAVEKSIKYIDAGSTKVTTDVSHVVCNPVILMLYPDKSVAISTQFAGLKSLLSTRLRFLGLQLSILSFKFSVACLELLYLFK